MPAVDDGDRTLRGRASCAGAGRRRPPRRARRPPGGCAVSWTGSTSRCGSRSPGKVKAGKSTLLNALVGEQVAPTDAGRVHPRRHLVPRRAHPADRDAPGRSARRLPLPWCAGDGALVIDLRRHPRRPRGPAGGRLAVAEPAGGHADRHAGDRVDVGRHGSAAPCAFLDPDDDTPTEADAVIYLMRHLHATDAAFPRGVPGPRGGQGHRGQHDRGDLAGRRDRRRPGRRDVLRPGDRPALPGPSPRCAGCARTSSRWPVCSPRPAARCGRPSSPRSPSWPGCRARTSTQRCCPSDRFVRPDGAVAAALPALSDEARRELLARFGLFGIRSPTMLIRQGVDNPADAGDRDGRAQRPARAAARAAHPVHRAP